MKSILKRKSNLLLYCTVIILSNLPGYAQVTQRVITITQSAMDIPRLAKMIATQTGLEYSLNMQNSSLKKNVQLKPGKWKLEDVMKEVQQQVGLNYKVIGDHILFTDYKPAKKVDSVQVTRPTKRIQHTINITTPAPITTYTAYDLSPLNADYAPTAPSFQVKPARMMEFEQTNHEMASKPAREKRHFTFPNISWPPWTQIGLTANDMVYLSASFKAGIQYAYGIVTLGASANGMRFRYGLGVSLPLNENESLHAEFTTGTLSRAPVAKDSAALLRRIKERYNSYGISWSKQIRPRLSMQFELNYSTLKKKYDSLSTRYMSDEYNTFKYGSVPYTTRFGSDGRLYDLRSWIGIRASIFYNLRRRED